MELKAALKDAKKAEENATKKPKLSLSERIMLSLGPKPQGRSIDESHMEMF